MVFDFRLERFTDTVALVDNPGHRTLQRRLRPMASKEEV